MPNFLELAQSVINVARKITPLIPGKYDDMAVAAGQAGLKLIDSFKRVTGSTTDELEAARAGLEERVLKGLEDEAKALEGN